MLFTCGEHLEVAIDRFVNEEEAAPEIFRVDTVKVEQGTCLYCGGKANYVLAKFGEVREQD